MYVCVKYFYVKKYKRIYKYKKISDIKRPSRCHWSSIVDAPGLPLFLGEIAVMKQRVLHALWFSYTISWRTAMLGILLLLAVAYRAINLHILCYLFTIISKAGRLTVAIDESFEGEVWFKTLHFFLHFLFVG